MKKKGLVAEKARLNDDRISLPELALRDAPFHGRYPMKSVMCLHMKQGWYREASSLFGDEAFSMF